MGQLWPQPASAQFAQSLAKQLANVNCCLRRVHLQQAAGGIVGTGALSSAMAKFPSATVIRMERTF
jgi:hypothetical protein